VVYFTVIKIIIPQHIIYVQKRSDKISVRDGHQMTL